MAGPKTNVFTIPASAPFLPALIDALIENRLGLKFDPAKDPLALASVTLYLPTRRACRLARGVFLGRSDAAVLPRIVPIGDVDADELVFAEAAAGEGSEDALQIKEALGRLERRMVLAELILEWAKKAHPITPGQASLVAANPASALMLAGDLARLMDDIATRQVGWDELVDKKKRERLVLPEMDEHWEIAFRFLEAVRAGWPAVLDALDRSEPAERRDKLIEAERARLEHAPGPVIAAGSTGSMPATAALLDAIAKLPHGAVVLPGLDTDLDDVSWKAIGSEDEAAHGHPQFAMHALLRRIGIERDAVGALTPPVAHGRERFASEALRPASVSEQWQSRLSDPDLAANVDTAMSSVSVIEAANAEEEALAIAIALRHAMETPGKTAALVTPDRGLARRVIAGLSRWGVPVDDSGGDALADTPLGVFSRLVAEAALDGLAPVKLLAMLKHPLCRVDDRALTVLERTILRGPRPKAGAEGLQQALIRFRQELARHERGETSELHRADPRVHMHTGEIDAADKLVTGLIAALAPLETLGNTPLRFAEIAKAHRNVLDALLDPAKIDAGSAELREFDAIFDTIIEGGRIVMLPADYPEAFRAALGDGGVVRPRERDVRVRIYGPLEARLQNVDLMVLGGLTEGTWPPETRADPWLSRPMRQSLGLDLPERRIGLSAHDFAQALGAPEIALTRAARVGGAPTVASRFMQRLAAVAGAERWGDAVKRGDVYLRYARALDRPAGRAQQVRRPDPRPPREIRPTRLNVTDIETLLRDPYSIYAKYILRLRPLDPVDTPLGARDRGTVIHRAIGDFTSAFADNLPDDVEGELLKLGQQFFAPLQDFPDAKAFWWPRFRRIARWFEQFERERRKDIAELYAEIGGELTIPLGDREFTLRSRADRIEQRKDGTFAILDYKTGRTSSRKEVRSGLAPQLTLEAAILRAGGFGDFGIAGSVKEIAYISIRGGEPAGELKPIAWDDASPDDEAKRALQKLTTVITQFDDPQSPYYSKERPMFIRRHPGDYDHLARVREWSMTGGAEDDQAEPE